jgi:hypothetical protein
VKAWECHQKPRLLISPSQHQCGTGKGRKASAELHYRFWSQAGACLHFNLSDFQNYRHNHGAAAGGFLDEALELGALSSVIQ